MKNILKYKKSIFLATVILITVITLLCTFLPKQNVITIDNSNADFCYDLAELADAEDPLTYANVKRIFEYNGDFNILKLSCGNKNIILETDIINNVSDIAINFSNPVADCNKIEIFALCNTSFNNIQNCLPTFEVKNSEFAATLYMTKQPLNLFKYNKGIDLKILINIF